MLPVPLEPGNVLVESLPKVTLAISEDGPGEPLLPRGAHVADVLPSTDAHSQPSIKQLAHGLVDDLALGSSS